MFKKLLYDNEELSIFEKIITKSKKDLKIWNLANLIFPIATILISLLFYFFSDKGPRATEAPSRIAIKILDFLLNGAIPLLGINLLVACSFYLIKFDKNKEEKFGLTTSNLRLKLIVYSLLSYLLMSALFAIQTIYNPFNHFGTLILQLFFSIVGISFSLGVANKLFLLQEEFINKSYDEAITENVVSLKNAIE